MPYRPDLRTRLDRVREKQRRAQVEQIEQLRTRLCSLDPTLQRGYAIT